MKKLFSLTLASAAILALSGCDSVETQDIQLIKGTFTKGETGKSIVTVYNDSSFDIVEISTARGNGGYTTVSPAKRVYAGNSRTFKTNNCTSYDEDWTIQVVDENGDYAERDFKRQCGYHEYFNVIDN
jgi:hypothetical protein